MLPSELFYGQHLRVLPTFLIYIERTVGCIITDHNFLLAVPLKPIAKVVCDCKLAYLLSKSFCWL